MRVSTAGVRLRAAMGSACAWDPDGRSVACSFSDGSLVITVRRPQRHFHLPFSLGRSSLLEMWRLGSLLCGGWCEASAVLHTRAGLQMRLRHLLLLRRTCGCGRLCGRVTQGALCSAAATCRACPAAWPQPGPPTG
jgi:hypothetical protein